MTSQATLPFLLAFQPQDQANDLAKMKCLRFIEQFPDDFFKRTLTIGHLTGSAWIVNHSLDKAILVHHRKLNQWFQPGGHIEEQDQTIFETSLREAREETGLTTIQSLGVSIFDIDIHLIPENKSFPAHWHYDIRFIFQADENELIEVSEESQAVKWWNWEEIALLSSSNESIMRMIRNTKMFISHLLNKKE